jgi:hypothetical protein
MPQVKFASRGSVFIEVSARNKITTVFDGFLFMVDTGATCTTINRRNLHDLGYDDNWIKTFGVKLPERECPILADKRRATDCYKIKLPEVKIEGVEGGNWEFMTSFSADFTLLFGTDSMRFFNWTFDYMNGMCRFQGIPRLKAEHLDGTQYIRALSDVDENIAAS